MEKLPKPFVIWTEKSAVGPVSAWPLTCTITRVNTRSERVLHLAFSAFRPVAMNGDFGRINVATLIPTLDSDEIMQFQITHL